MANLGSLFNVNELTKEALDIPVDEDLLRNVSDDVDMMDQWECLATGIGVAEDIVHDLKELAPDNKCLALLRRWKQLYGSGATYLKLIEGFEYPTVGRRALTENVIKYVVITKKKSSNETATFRQRHRLMILCLILVVVILALILIIAAVGQVMITVIGDTLRREDFRITEYSSLPGEYLDNDTLSTCSCSDILLKQRVTTKGNTSECTVVFSDLPNVQSSLFVGRDRDIDEICEKVQRSNIVNVNGPPGFGKSSVVIHAGYKLVKNGTSVRYIDVEQKFPLFNFTHFENYPRSNNKTNFRHKRFNKETTAILKTLSSIGGRYNDQVKSGMGKSTNYVEELLLWSKGVDCFTVLILDNCDDLISSKLKFDFVDLVYHIAGSFVHIIVVSQAKLLLVDSFDQWSVKELSTDDSVELLQKLAPGIGSSHAKTVSEFVERCPLALKVVGSILHHYGSDTLTRKLELELKNNPIGVLDQADQRRLQFRVIMDLAFSRIGDLISNECGHFVSLFPSSFSSEAGLSILPQPKVCLDTLVKFSLLDEYFYYDHLQRYRMHRLIKEFLRDTVTHMVRKWFKERFSGYFEDYLVQYATGGLKQLDAVDEYKISLETQNIQHYLSFLIDQELCLTPKQLVILSYGITTEIVSFNALKPHFKTFMTNLNQVCSFVDNDRILCGKLYSDIVQHFYTKCQCRTVSQYFKHLKSTQCPCTSQSGIFQCQTVLDINRTESIWVSLTTPIQRYLERIVLYNCYHDHVFAFNFFICNVLLLCSVIMNNLCRHCHRHVLSFAVYIFASILHAAFQVRGEVHVVAVVEIFLKTLCFKLLFLLFLCMSLLVIHTVRQMLYVVVILSVFYVLMYYLWRDTTYPLQGCDFLPLCQ